MARVSFSLRRDTGQRGSYARYDEGTFTTEYGAVTRDDDQYLRSDGYTLPPASSANNFLDIRDSEYGRLRISWSATSEAATGTGATQLAAIVLVYSPDGEPQTVDSGVSLVVNSSVFDGSGNSLNESTYIHDSNTPGVPGPVQGRWAYYSLFAFYDDGAGGNYYERVVSQRVLVTKYLGSLYSMWDRIPEYYRDADSEVGVHLDPTDPENLYLYGYLPFNNSVGPLFKYLSIFAFEMDRLRTIIDYSMVSRDPSIADTEVLDAVANELGVLLNSDALGASRLRPLVDSLPTIRSRKGTLASILEYAKLVTNSDVEVVDNGSGAIDVYVFSQRVNWVQDPEGTVFVTTLGSETVRSATVGEITDPYSSGVPSTVRNPASAVTNTFTVSSGVTGDTTLYSDSTAPIMFRIPDPLAVKQGDTVAVSIHSLVGDSTLQWARLLDSSGNEVGFSSRATKAGDAKAVQVPASANVSATAWTEVYLEFLVDARSVSGVDVAKLLVERNNLGEYFNGSTVRGGWLDTSATSADYQWAGSANGSRSIYTNQRVRTNGVFSEAMKEVVPITLTPTYYYDQIPGVHDGTIT